MTKTDCSLCPRLTEHRLYIKARYPDYYCRPVEAFGASQAELFIVGLAPGLHGANASGRPFTGDASGDLLFKTLHKFGYSSHSFSQANQDIQLNGCRITNAVKCLPPQNKPITSEIHQCNQFLKAEIQLLKPGAVILAFGGISHRAILLACDLRPVDYRFAHEAVHKLSNGLSLIDSYHCSRYNIQTKRLTVEMFERVFHRISTI